VWVVYFILISLPISENINELAQHNLNSFIYNCPTSIGFERIALVMLKDKNP
jgi:hypothetical protein